MTKILQNVKYMQSIYRKFQIFAIACAIVTLIAAVLAALSGIQLNKLRKAQAKTLENATLTNSQVNVDVQKELKETKLFLKSSQQQLNEEKEKVERLQQMLNGLERQLSAAQAKAALKADEAPVAPKSEKPPAVSATPRVRQQSPSTNKPNPSPIPTVDEPKPSSSANDATDAAIPAPPSENTGASEPGPQAENPSSD